jgi:hypothetical protein
MVIQSQLSEIFISLFKSNNGIITGGGTGNKIGTFFYLLLIFFILLLVKSYIVQLAYNHVIPSIIYSLDIKQNMKYEDIKNNFKHITYVEAILLVILFNMLFTKI